MSYREDDFKSIAGAEVSTDTSIAGVDGLAECASILSFICVVDKRRNRRVSFSALNQACSMCPVAKVTRFNSGDVE